MVICHTLFVFMLEDIMRDRMRKLSRYEEKTSAYPIDTKRTMAIGAFLKAFSGLARAKKRVTVAGRVLSLRDQGKIIFADLADESGKIQLVLNAKEMKDFTLLRETLEVGDFAEAEGAPFVTKRGEKSVLVRRARILAKALRPAPSSWYGLEDPEVRFRKRYLDLLLDGDAKDIFRKKAVFWETVRMFLKEEGFLEIEMPVLEAVPGGAEAEPFVTHHNALDEDFYLRISLELPLKKMLVGGFEKVFEIGRVFRNEGIDREHLQDYTQMECYAAYEDYNDMMRLMERMYKRTIKALFGTLTLKDAQGAKVQWGKKWPKVDYYAAFKKMAGLDLASATEADLRAKAKALKLETASAVGRGRLIDLIYKKTVRPKLVQPCFLIDPPVEIEPLAKRSRKDPKRVERFQIVAYGTELGKGFSELNDPRDQRARFEEQMRLREQGDKEAEQLDEDFLEALEYGMPPASGFGLSERLFAVLMNKSVRETVVFPPMKKTK